MARDPTGKGYWLVASDGGIFTFGDATSTARPAHPPNKPIVGMARTRRQGLLDGRSRRRHLHLRRRPFRGSTGGVALPAPIKGVAASYPVAEGYWMLRSDGRVYSLGPARQLGSAVGMLGGRPTVGITAATAGGGFWIASQWGGVDSAWAPACTSIPNLEFHATAQKQSMSS